MPFESLSMCYIYTGCSFYQLGGFVGFLTFLTFFTSVIGESFAWFLANAAKKVDVQIVIGGRGQFNYEYLQKNGAPNLYNLPFLAQTDDPGTENNLYPFVFLIGDGNLFIFANNGAILFDYSNNKIINGGAAGTASWELGRNPVLKPLLYRPDDKVGSRFELQNPATIPRKYHSTGRVLVGGSNPHEKYKFKGVLNPTELSLEAFCPAYLDPENFSLRPKIILLSSQVKLKYKQKLVRQEPSR
ncbi:hypothetical protein Ddye_026505 [Dipteronia dyeriana]|uniref:Glyoxal oxidase N-terminal domain-containing protein n=1 Tax=Dipteronia dyeriana TaxID=168575 RepID=A0AAD9TNE1_9ROSI|nr:hypothetical protein Ddye_026505 [Dipteronia dyeriana]